MRNKVLENMAVFKYLRTVTSENYIYKEAETRLNSEMLAII
jgi:hypothetical protein